MLPKVHIRKEAVLSMIWAATETFKRECLGFLWGRLPSPKLNRFLISDAVPFQSVHHRLNTEVQQSQKGERRLKEWTALLKRSSLRHVGDFHSHPEWGKIKGSEEISAFDIKEMLRHKTPLEIIIAISSRKRGPLPWGVLPDGSIKGSLGKFVFHLCAYGIEDKNGEKLSRRLHIVAPAAIKFLNRINKY